MSGNISRVLPLETRERARVKTWKSGKRPRLGRAFRVESRDALSMHLASAACGGRHPGPPAFPDEGHGLIIGRPGHESRSPGGESRPDVRMAVGGSVRAVRVVSDDVCLSVARSRRGPQGGLATIGAELSAYRPSVEIVFEQVERPRRVDTLDHRPAPAQPSEGRAFGCLSHGALNGNSHHGSCHRDGLPAKLRAQTPGYAGDGDEGGLPRRWSGRRSGTTECGRR